MIALNCGNTGRQFSRRQPDYSVDVVISIGMRPESQRGLTDDRAVDRSAQVRGTGCYILVVEILLCGGEKSLTGTCSGGKQRSFPSVG